jgi:hypothetical protein
LREFVKIIPIEDLRKIFYYVIELEEFL